MLNRHTIGLFAVIFSAVFLLFVSSAHAGMIIQHPNYTGLNQGLVGYWSFDGKDMSGTTAYDRSGQGNNGTLTNGPVKTIGKIGQALNFDGVDDGVQTALTSNNDIHTYSMWIFQKTIGGNGLGRIFDKRNSGDTEIELLYTNSHVSCSGSPSGFGCFEFSRYWSLAHPQWNFVIPSANAWHHIVVIYDGTSPENIPVVYEDGMTVAVINNGAAPSGTLLTNTSSYWIGNRGSGDRAWDGQIDDIRIYNRVLNQDEIKRLYKIGGTLHTNTSINNDSLTKGLVGYWSFDGKDMSGTTAYDRSGQGNNGTLTNGPTKTIGKLGQALNFDGVNDFISIPQNGKFNVSTSAFTISLWINDPSLAANLTPGSNFQRIVSWYDGTNNIQLGIGSDDSVTRQFYVINTTITGTAPISTGAVTAGYHHVVATYNGSGYAMYVDGLSSNGTPLSGSGISVFTGNSTTLYIGQRGDSARWTNGKIDDVRIYNRALNQDEIKRLYKIGGTLHTNTSINNDSLTKGLVGYWSFDGKDMSGTTAYDRSGQGNNGTLTNGPVKTIGKLGQALNFDGCSGCTADDVVKITQSSSLNNLSAITFSAWIYPKSSGESGLGDYVVKKGSSSSANPVGWVFVIDPAGATTLTIDYSVTNLCQQLFSGPAKSTWTHAVFTWDGSSSQNGIKFYYNGIQQGNSGCSDGAGSRVNDSTSNLWIGNNGGDTTNHTFDGFIDDVRIYNRVLTPAEIQRLYNLGR